MTLKIQDYFLEASILRKSSEEKSLDFIKIFSIIV